MDLAAATHETFAPLQGGAFVVAGLTLTLEAVTVHEERPGMRTPFSLEFTGPAEPALPQQIHRLEHPELGTLEVFLVPIGPCRYEAVFA